MFKIDEFFKTKTGMNMLSVLLGLGIAGMFKMSCDNRSCLVYRAGDLSENKIFKYNDQCYEATEKIETCDNNRHIIDV
jgi:hypothetical protein|tara:strand:+ start:80 stop:313 length:234 start_codon:yes stop_codon:yes gene_type:complete